MSESRTVVLLCTDLMMTSTVSGAVAECGLQFRSLSATNQLTDTIDQDLIIIDLATPGLDLEHAAAVLNEHQLKTAIIYGPHVHTERFEQAREAGFRRVMARGRFNTEITRIVQGFADVQQIG